MNKIIEIMEFKQRINKKIKILEFHTRNMKIIKKNIEFNK